MVSLNTSRRACTANTLEHALFAQVVHQLIFTYRISNNLIARLGSAHT